MSHVALSDLWSLMSQEKYADVVAAVDGVVAMTSDVVEAADGHRLGVQAAFRLGDVATARRHGLAQLACALRASDAALEGRAHNDLAVLDGFEGHTDAALDRLWKASEAFQRTPSGPSPAVLNNLGNLYLQMGRFDEATGHFHRAVEGFRATSDLANMALSLANVGRSEAYAGRAGLAIEPLDEALAIFERLGRTDDVAATLAKLGLAHAKDGAHERAKVCFDRALEAHARGVGAPFENDTRYWYASASLDRGDHERVVDLLGHLARHEGEATPIDPINEFIVGPRVILSHALGRLGRHEEAFEVLSRLYRAIHLHATESHRERLQRRMSERDGGLTIKRGSVAERGKPLTSDMDERIVDLERMVVGLRARAERLERAAHTDALTGLANRRGFERVFSRMLADARRVDGKLVAALVDLDDFKRVNDVHGHDVGDKVLSQVASIFVRALPVDAVVARWGGEEFVVALPDVTLDRAEEILDDLRSRVERHPWSSVAEELHVTCSAGAVAWFETTASEVLLSVADRRLYAAKRAGRNRVVVRDQAS